jgi:hypothetical protein
MAGHAERVEECEERHPGTASEDGVVVRFGPPVIRSGAVGHRGKMRQESDAAFSFSM